MRASCTVACMMQEGEKKSPDKTKTNTSYWYDQATQASTMAMSAKINSFKPVH